MNLLCNREGLLSAIQLANSVVPSRDVNPILRNLKVTADADRVTVTATDTELGVRIDVAVVQVKDTGEALIPAQKLLDVLRASTDDELTIEADLMGTTVKGKQSSFEMPGEDPHHYPDFPTCDGNGWNTIGASDLRVMISRVKYAAAAAEHARYGAMTGVAWQADGATLRLVATDGRRLAVSERGDTGPIEGTPVLPAKAVVLLEKNLHGDDPIKFRFSTNEAIFVTETTTVYTRLVEGRYPQWQQVLPDSSSVTVPIVVGDFARAVRQAQVMTDDESKKVTFAFSEGLLMLTASGSATGKSSVEMPVEYVDKPLTICFDPKFLLDMLKQFEPTEVLHLDMTDGKSRVLFHNDTGDFRYVVVPVVVKE